MTPDDDLSLAELVAWCRRVYGTERWAALLAADLSRTAGRQVAPSQVNQWQAGSRAVPAWVADALPPAWHTRAHRLNLAAAHTRAVADEVAARFAPVPEAEPDEGEDLAPRM